MLLLYLYDYENIYIYLSIIYDVGHFSDSLRPGLDNEDESDESEVWCVINGFQ